MAPTSPTPTDHLGSRLSAAGRPHLRRWAAGAASMVLALGLAACGGQGAQPTSPSDSTDQETSSQPGDPSAAGLGGGADLANPAELATDLEVPWGIETFDDGALLMSERDSGRILRISPEGDIAELGTVGAVPSSEGGMLGVTLSPQEDFVYAYYSTDTDNQVVRFPLEGEMPGDGAAGQLSLGEEEVLLTSIPMAGIHNGGQVRFGPDGMLYVATGDATVKPDAQDPQSLAGKILRLTPEGEPAEGNAWGNEVYSIGHRNVQGLTWDDQGRLWASEFGDATWDELNLIESGQNYGWPEVEGESDQADGEQTTPDQGDGEQGGEFTDPVHTWAPSEASPSGLGYWNGSLWMGALRGTTLWQIPVTEATGGLDNVDQLTETPVPHWQGEYGRLRAVVGFDDGPLVVGTSNRDGRAEPRDGDDRLLVVDQEP